MILRQFLIRLCLISFVKLIGALGKIPLYRMVGAEGIGLYQMAYSYYGLILTLITFGLPTALSFTALQHPAERWILLKRSAIILLLVGCVTGFLTFHFSTLIVDFFGDSHLLWAIRAISPALIVVPLLSLLRGYLRGLEYYTLIAASEVVEQVIRVGVMLLCVSLWLRFGMDFAVSGATLAASISAICTLAFLFYFVYQTNQSHVFHIHAKSKTKHSFVRSSSLILLTQLIIPIADFLSTIIIPSRLTKTGMTIHEGTAVLGQYFGMTNLIIYIPTLVTSALAHVLMIKFCLDWQKKRFGPLRKKIIFILQFVSVWGLASALLLMFFSQEISMLVVGDESIRFCIFYLALAPLLAGLQSMTTTALWATDSQKSPLLGLGLGSAISLLIYFFLIPIPGFHYWAIIIGFLITDAICTIWNLGALYKKFRHVRESTA